MRTRTGAIGISLLLAFAGSSTAAEWFVATNGNDAAEGTNWATAKLTIQAGIDVSAANDTVWVSNGVYATGGGRAVAGTWPNRVAIDRAITVQSANGPETAFIVGDDMRCAYVANGATLSGFTLTNGTTYRIFSGGDFWTNPDYQGGGALCEDSGTLTNCVLMGNWACVKGGGSCGGNLNNCTMTGNGTSYGGGSFGGTLNRCVLTGNSTDMVGGGAAGGTLNDCVLASNTTSYGGGAHGCTLNRCLIQDNVGSSEGGGMCGGTLNQCVVSGNRSVMGGGAAQDAVLNNCLVVSNAATGDEEGWRGGGGARQCRLYNCTVAGNTAVGEGGGIFLSAATNCIVVDNSSSMGLGSNYRDSTLGYSCTNPDPGGTGNVTHDPQFADAGAGDYRLAAGSPCIDAGDNAGIAGAVDLDGNPRIVNAFVDMGAYEYPAAGGTVLVAVAVRTNVGDGAVSGKTIEVTANVAWTAATNAPWLAIMSGESGTTNGTVTFDVAANAGAARTGAVIVAGSDLSRTCTVVQAAFVPALTVFPASTNAGSGGASGLALGVTANVAWTAATNAPWLAIISGESGTTNGTVLFDVAANAGAARTGTIVVAGGGLARTCTVVQAAFVPALAVSPASTNVGSGAASGLMLGVTANVAWTAATNAPWLAISSGESGTTNGTVMFDVAANAGAARTGRIVVAGGGLARTCTVVQIKNPALAANWYVATNGNNAAAGTNWATAKQTIQAAVDAAEAGDAVWVSNGVYDTGGRVVYGGMTNRVAIGKPITVQSVYGPDVTILRGGVATRCAYVGTNAVLSGFTLTNGATRNVEFADHARERSGGGAWCESSGALSNCVLSGNSAGSYGGGAYGGTLRNCALNGNSAWWGGGAHGATLWACEISGNSVAIGGSGGGVDSCTANLCVISGNRADLSRGGGANESTLNNCIVSDNLALIGGGTHAGAANNCVIIGNWAGSGFPDDGTGGGGSAGGTLINCIVYGNGATSGSNYLSSAFQHSCTAPHPGGTGNIASVPQFVDAAAGNYRVAAGSPCINAGDNAAAPGATDLDGNPRIVFGTVDMGAYEFLYQHVAPGGSDGASGFSWAEAKQTIQAAVDATTNGCIVLVTNGVYDSGPGASQRIALTHAVSLRSMNGAGATIIRGNNGRCISVAHAGAAVSGFTITGGRGGDGAGVNMPYKNALLENCIVCDNGTLDGAGTVWGGAIYGGRIRSCLIVSNFIYLSSGERYSTTAALGAGAAGCILENCTLADNVASVTGYYEAAEGGYYDGDMTNTIVWSNWGGTSYSGSHWSDNMGNPGFVDGDYRLASNSPCIDAGNNAAVSGATDLDGNPRIAFGAVDLGAYEAQLTGAGTWFGAITNGQTGDLDCVAGDGVPNLLKYATGGSPRISDDNALLECLTTGTRPTLAFHRNPSATDVRYVVEGTDRLTNGAAWRGLATNVGGSWLGATNVSESGTGNPVECTVTDPVALQSNRFLRLRVSRP